MDPAAVNIKLAYVRPITQFPVVHRLKYLMVMYAMTNTKLVFALLLTTKLVPVLMKSLQVLLVTVNTKLVSMLVPIIQLQVVKE